MEHTITARDSDYHVGTVPILEKSIISNGGMWGGRQADACVQMEANNIMILSNSSNCVMS